MALKSHVVPPPAVRWFAEVKLMKYMRLTVGQLKCTSGFAMQTTAAGGEHSHALRSHPS